MTLLDLIRQNWLVPIRAKTIPLEINLDDVGTTAGDYNAKDLGHAIEPYLERIADVVVEHRHRKILAFLPLVSLSRDFAVLCCERGLRAEHVDGTSEDRRDILARFGRGYTSVLTNAMLLTEGYDEPSIDCVVCLRPTKLRALYSQIVGRGTRLAAGKDHLLLLDFLWMSEEHNLVKPANLIAAIPMKRTPSPRRSASKATLMKQRAKPTPIAQPRCASGSSKTLGARRGHLMRSSLRCR